MEAGEAAHWSTLLGAICVSVAFCWRKHKGVERENAQQKKQIERESKNVVNPSRK